MSEEFRKDAIKGLMSDIEIVLSNEYRVKHESKEHPEWNRRVIKSNYTNCTKEELPYGADPRGSLYYFSSNITKTC